MADYSLNERGSRKLKALMAALAIVILVLVFIVQSGILSGDDKKIETDEDSKKAVSEIKQSLDELSELIEDSAIQGGDSPS
jgi:cytochrome b